MKKLRFLGLALLVVAGFVLFFGCEGPASPAGGGGATGPWTASGPDWSSYTQGSANKAVQQMTAGWNLGNTFDMLNISIEGKENSSQFPPTTRENIRAFKEQGFNVIRLPVSWNNGIREMPMEDNFFIGNYQLHPTYLARIGEVVQWIIDEGMYCIMDAHHTDGIFAGTGLYNEPVRDSRTKFYPDGRPGPGTKFIDTAAIAMREVYKQVAEYFKDYDYKLIIEALNEPKNEYEGNNKDGVSPNTWAGGTAEQHNNLNYLYQVFLDTIRANGTKPDGTRKNNNYDRLLMFPTYAASATELAMNGLLLPTDIPANRGFNNRLIVDIHAYTPYRFTLNNEMGTQPIRQNGDSYYTEWSADSTSFDTGPRNMQEQLNLAVKHFVSKGIPVIWGETGCVNRYKDIYKNAVRMAAGVNSADGEQGTGTNVRTKTAAELADIGLTIGQLSWEFNHEAREANIEYFFKLGKDRGIPFVLWDNGHMFNLSSGSDVDRFVYLVKADGSKVLQPGKLSASVNGNDESIATLNRYDNTFPYPYIINAIQRAVGLPVKSLPPFNPDVTQPAQNWTNATAISPYSKIVWGPWVFETPASGWDDVPIQYFPPR